MNTITKKILLSCILFGWGTIILYAQQDTVPPVNESTGGTVNYSIGEAEHISIGVGETAKEGLKKPYEILVLTGINEKGINLSADLILDVEKTETQSMRYVLSDLQGKLISQQRITSKQTTIPMAGLPDAAYFIKVLTKNTELKTFKISKK